MADIIELILADHRRIRRLAATLQHPDGCRWDVGHWGRLAAGWARLAILFDLHTAAEEEICWPVLAPSQRARQQAREAAADHDDICEAISESWLHRTGSVRWWGAVHDALAGCTTHLDYEEHAILGQLAAHAGPTRRSQLACQWKGFVAAWERDQCHRPARQPDPLPAPLRYRFPALTIASITPVEHTHPPSPRALFHPRATLAPRPGQPKAYMSGPDTARIMAVVP